MIIPVSLLLRHVGPGTLGTANISNAFARTDVGTDREQYREQLVTLPFGIAILAASLAARGTAPNRALAGIARRGSCRSASTWPAASPDTFAALR